MIRTLMASSAILVLLIAGAVAAKAEDTAAPVATQQLDASTTAMKIQQPTLLSILMGKAVYSSEDPQSDKIGDVNDLIIGNNGVITHAVIGVGGFLGIGEKDVAVPFDDLKVAEKDGDTRLIYGATREHLSAAPAIDRATYQRLQNPEAATLGNEPAVPDSSVAQQTAASDPATADAEECSAAWVSADADQDGNLDANESARYLAALRVANRPANDASLTQPVFLENCKAGYFVETAAADPGAPFEGANSFTEGQAQDRILAAGYLNVSPLTKDDKGIWRGSAEAQGKKVNIAVDYKGNVVATNM